MSGFRASRRARLAASFALLPLFSGATAAIAADAGKIDFYAVENAPKGMSLPFSEAVRAGDMLYLAGMLGTDASGKLAAGGIRAEANTCSL